MGIYLDLFTAMHVLLNHWIIIVVEMHISVCIQWNILSLVYCIGSIL